MNMRAIMLALNTVLITVTILEKVVRMRRGRSRR